MGTKITATIFEDAEAWLTENVPDMSVDGISAVYRISKFDPAGLTQYHDEEETVTKSASMADHVRALKKLCELIDSKKLFVGRIRNAQELKWLGNWDIEVTDAYFQLIYHDEVIYG